MNKLLLDTPGGPVLLCVLEPGNLYKLQQKSPIEFSLNELYPRGLPAKLSLAICYSETPIADQKAFEKLLAPGGEYVDTRSPALKKVRPHCPECRSTIEQLGVFRNESPVWLVFCSACGSVLGAIPPVGEWKR